MMKLLEVIDKANGYFFSESAVLPSSSAATGDVANNVEQSTYPSVMYCLVAIRCDGWVA